MVMADGIKSCEQARRDIKYSVASEFMNKLGITKVQMKRGNSIEILKEDLFLIMMF